MAAATQAATTDAPKAKKKRTASGPKRIFAVVQIMDADGNVRTDVAKAQIKIVSFERSAEAVLEKIESGDHPGAVYLSGFLPAGGPRTPAK